MSEQPPSVSTSSKYSHGHNDTTRLGLSLLPDASTRHLQSPEPYVLRSLKSRSSHPDMSVLKQTTPQLPCSHPSSVPSRPLPNLIPTNLPNSLNPSARSSSLFPSRIFFSTSNASLSPFSLVQIPCCLSSVASGPAAPPPRPPLPPLPPRAPRPPLPRPRARNG